MRDGTEISLIVPVLRKKSSSSSKQQEQSRAGSEQLEPAANFDFPGGGSRCRRRGRSIESSKLLKERHIIQALVSIPLPLMPRRSPRNHSPNWEATHDVLDAQIRRNYVGDSEMLKKLRSTDFDEVAQHDGRELRTLAHTNYRNNISSSRNTPEKGAKKQGSGETARSATTAGKVEYDPYDQVRNIPLLPIKCICGSMVAFASLVFLFPESVSTRSKIFALLATAAAMGSYLYVFVPPIPQDKTYHNFADSRCLCCNVPNTFDVLSNVPFVLLGMLSLALQLTGALALDTADATTRYAWAFLWISIAAVGFGSGYYHWAPDNATLVWDRLPMTLGFTALTALVIDEHLGAGLELLPLMVAGGIGSVVYWARTDDLRPYAFVQAFPLVALPFILALFPPKYDSRVYYIYALGWYMIAKIAEAKDREIFAATGGVVSGHTLKHLAAAGALSMLTRMLVIRDLSAYAAITKNHNHIG